jgi:hypothetical protein
MELLKNGKFLSAFSLRKMLSFHLGVFLSWKKKKKKPKNVFHINVYPNTAVWQKYNTCLQMP